MTNKLAIILGLIVVAAFAFDAFYYGGSTTMFLGRKFYVFLDWLAFWR